jgi:hypothetical protein
MLPVKYRTNLYMVLDTEDDDTARMMVEGLVVDLNIMLGHYMGADAVLTWPEHYNMMKEQFPAEEVLELVMGDCEVELPGWAEMVSDTKH